MVEPRHVSVLAQQCVAALAPTPAGVYLDGTFGAGGHSQALLEAGAGHVLALDRDLTTQAQAQAMQARYPGRFSFAYGQFARMQALAHAAGFQTVDGILLDIGVSSMQLDTPERGFSFRADGPLDMRMEQGEGRVSAADLVNTLDEAALKNILRTLGEEPRAGRVARAIVAARTQAPILTTGQLAALVHKALGGAHGPKDPATRTFQALRMALNDELGQLSQALLAAQQLLNPGGRLAIISFHSLEDRLVKQFLRLHSGATPRASRHSPLVEESGEGSAAPTFRQVAKPIRPDAAEIARNPRARSAILRVATRTDAPASGTTAFLQASSARHVDMPKTPLAEQGGF
jgi:16S rRNA (cytosine1402-N4)-methyltransferase